MKSFTNLNLIIFCILLNLLTSVAHAQVDREFWFAIPKETSGHGCIGTGGDCNMNDVSFKITAMSLDAHVIISMPANSSNFPERHITVPAGTSHIEVLATDWVQFDSVYANRARWNQETLSGKSNHGILIKSDNDITVYYDYDDYWNRDLFSLKGKNALGTEFYASFQNIWGNGSYSPYPYSDIDIVATEDSTDITVYPTQPVQGFTFPGTIKFRLNKGQTYTLRAKGVNGSDHLGGTRIVSNKKIAVTVNDDSVLGANDSCRDIIGDQTVPTSIIGAQYVVMAGDRSRNQSGVQGPQEINLGDQIFVTATQPNTIIYFKDKAGNLLHQTGNLSAGQSDYFTMDKDDPNRTSIYVYSNDDYKPFYVLHTTGISCELGGGILPPITNCTGSSEVNFYRSNTVNDITVNLMIPYDKTKAFSDLSQSYNFFTLYTYDAAGNTTNTYKIPGSWFEPNEPAGWAVLKLANRDFNSITTKNRAHKITNSQDFFHLGMTNGTDGQTNKYGYFSSFNVATAGVRVSSTETQDYIGCKGKEITLIATGGLSYKWHYGTPGGPGSYLDNDTSATPTVNKNCPSGSHNYYVVVKQSKCFGYDTLKVNVIILPQTTAKFETDKTIICAVDSVHFLNKSEEASTFTWTKIENGVETPFSPTNDMSFYDKLDNPNSFPREIRYKLYAEHAQGCNDTISKVITVYPKINAEFNPKDSSICDSSTINFKLDLNRSYGIGTLTWDFGDQGSASTENPDHNYRNFAAHDTTYKVALFAKSPYFLCGDTARGSITVHPYIRAGFTIDTIAGCSPFTVKLFNNSTNRKAIHRYFWDFDYHKNTTPGQPRDTLSVYTNNDILHHTFPRNKTSVPVTDTIALHVFDQGGNNCSDIFLRVIKVYPETAIDINKNDTAICHNRTIAFDKTKADPAITTYLWDFGDGSTSLDKFPSHTFTNYTDNDVTYRVTVRGSWEGGACAGFDTMLVKVHARLTPIFTLDTASVCAPFNATISNASSGGITKYKWYVDTTLFSTTGDATQHYYFRDTTNNKIISTVKLVVENNGGCKDSMMQNITLYPEMKVSFTPSARSGCNPLTVNFTNTSNAAVVKNSYWDFGDGTTSYEKDPTHTFTNLRSKDTVFHITLKGSSSHDNTTCTATHNTPITVYSYINSDFTINKGEGCSPLTVTITDESHGGITKWNWNFGDGTWDSPSSNVVYTKTYTNNLNKTRTRSITLIVGNGREECNDTLTRPVKIHPQVFAGFTTKNGVTEGCTPLNIAFIDTSGAKLVPFRWDWAFRDSASSDEQHPQHTFVNETNYEKTFYPRLIVNSQNNCADTAENLKILVYPKIDAQFAFDKAKGCSPHTITITRDTLHNAITTNRNFYWDFGDGTTGNSKFGSFNHTYRNLTPSNVTYHPQLILAYNKGKGDMCQDTLTREVIVYPEVTAAFIQDTLKGCHPFTIHFKNTSLLGSGLAPAGALQYYWKYGDMGTYPFAEENHTYLNYSYADSFYIVNLKADLVGYGCSSTITKIVTVYPKPRAILHLDTIIACPPFKLKATNLSKAGDFYHWIFEPGKTMDLTTLNPVSYTYYNNNSSGIVDYDLKLKVESEHNCWDSVSQIVRVYPKVTASFTPDTAGCNSLTVPFKNHSRNADLFWWTFGDDTPKEDRNTSPTHPYFCPQGADSALYTVQLKAQSTYGCKHDTTSKVKVYQQPVAEFTLSKYYLEYPDNIVNIYNQTNAGTWQYYWDFKNGQTSVLKNPLTQAFTWGVYNIGLNVKSNYCKDSVSHLLKIRAPRPIPDFQKSADGCVPLEVQFNDKSTYAVKSIWDFNDGTPLVTGENVVHTFEKAGTYKVKLTVVGNESSDTAYTFKEVTVYPKPVVNFTVKPSVAMLSPAKEAPIKFYNTSKLGIKFLWNFGDNSAPSSEQEPVHTYTNVGMYTVSLKAWTTFGCTDSITKKDTISILGQGIIEYPNAFTPNINGPGDGTYAEPDTKNDVFHPYWKGVVTYHLEIYDRWGEKLFESDNVNIGWNGYYKGKLCKTDVYIWKAKGTYTTGATFEKAGNVTLLR